MPYDAEPTPVPERMPLRIAAIELMSRADREPGSRDDPGVAAALRELFAARPAAERLWLAYRAGRADRRAAVFAAYTD